MRLLFCVLTALILLTIPVLPVSDFEPVPVPPSRPVAEKEPEAQTETYIATAYILSDGNGDGRTATGITPSRGRTIAVDPRHIPYGSKVYINGQGPYVAEDTGGDIRGRRLDIYFGDSAEAYWEAMNFGRREVQVRVERGEE